MACGRFAVISASRSLHAGLQFLDDFWFGLGEVALFANVPGKVEEVQLRRISNGCLRNYIHNNQHFAGKAQLIRTKLSFRCINRNEETAYRMGMD
jgi:hypothetical protein